VKAFSVKWVGGIALAVIGAIGLYVVAPFASSFSSKAGEEAFKRVASPAASPSAPASASSAPAAASTRAVIRMSDYSGIENMTIDVGHNSIGIINDGITGAHFKDLRVKDARDVGILNKDSRDLSFERTEVDMSPPTK
jgi:hypothetical protein